MPSAPIPHDESDRLNALRALEVLDTPADEHLDRLTRTVAQICGTPIALITLIDHNRQWFKSNHGFDGVTETPRDRAFCDRTILDDDLLHVGDTATDTRFADNPLVAGPPGIRFYAGAPLILRNGHRVGALCVWDFEPRRLTTEQRQTLRDLAAVSAHMMEINYTANQTLTELSATAVRAESADLARTDFLAHMSHELRTPLNAVIGFAEMLQHEVYGPLPHAYHDVAATIGDSGTQLLSMIDDLLDLGMLEDGTITLHAEEVDLHDLIAEAVRMQSALARARGIHVEVALLDRPTSIADRRTIRQALINVIGHALKYGADKGVVELTVSRTANGLARITVRNDGAGMTDEQIARAFEPYGRHGQGRALEARIARDSHGLGLGVARRFVELNGGTLTLESELGAGTTVIIALPAIAGITPPKDRKGETPGASDILDEMGA